MAGGERVLLVRDADGAWYIRHVAVVEHDIDTDVKVYHCDQPIGGRFHTLKAALRELAKYDAVAGTNKPNA